MSGYFAINLALRGCDCLVVGGGRVALRKAQSLVACGALARVVSPEFCSELAQLEGVRLVQRPFEPQDVEGATIVFAATSDPEVNEAVARAARRRGIWVNVVDTPDLCDFIVPATVRRGALTISVSSGSAAPALSRRLRLDLEKQFPEAYGDFVALLAELRGDVLRRVADPAQRRAILRDLAEETTWALFARDGAQAVRDQADRLIRDAT
jgi:precorrin-2 dehydrogenase/sirohydrochlorin ferrochelatase